ncbi:MAG: hypothetical protein OQK71_03230 [Desulfobacter sp.]|nr:hypothetical protein [Desulfobacter sp.]
MQKIIYMDEDFRCSEAMLRVIWENLKTELPEEAVRYDRFSMPGTN